MLKKLRWKMILAAMAATFLVLLLLTAGINLIHYQQTEKEIRETLAMLQQSGGSLDHFMEDSKKQPQPAERKEQFSPEKPYMTRFFAVGWDLDGNVNFVNTRSIAAIERETALELANQVKDSGKRTGQYQIYHYEITESDTGTMVIFLDCEMQQQNGRSLFWISTAVCGGGFLAIFVLVILFSGIAVRPFARNLEKQKRFITDAGHELKTPLTIIASHAELLKMDIGENEWLSGIEGQTVRMQKLVGEMIQLARYDEANKLKKETFFLDEAVSDTALAFSGLAKQQALSFSVETKESISYLGDEGQIRKLCSILCDNAVKYCDPQGSITVSLQTDSGKHPVLTVTNDYAAVGEIELTQLFDRFYRADDSRCRKSGSYGLGLAIARAIAQGHRAKIEAKALDQKIAFVVTF